MIPANPKDVIGSSKIGISTVPAQVLIDVFGPTWFSAVSSSSLLEVALGMSEGAIKYGKHNYRSEGVRASIYFDAFMRHMLAWKDGETIDPDSGLSHIIKALCSTIVFRDAMLQGNWIDDRPIAAKSLGFNAAKKLATDEAVIYYYCLWFEGIDTVQFAGPLDGEKHTLNLVIQNLFLITDEREESGELTVKQASILYEELKRKVKDCGKHYDRHSVAQRKFAAEVPVPPPRTNFDPTGLAGWDPKDFPDESQAIPRYNREIIRPAIYETDINGYTKDDQPF